MNISATCFEVHHKFWGDFLVPLSHFVVEVEEDGDEGKLIGKNKDLPQALLLWLEVNRRILFHCLFSLRVCIDGVGKRDVGGLKEIWFGDRGYNWYSKKWQYKEDNLLNSTFLSSYTNTFLFIEKDRLGSFGKDTEMNHSHSNSILGLSNVRSTPLELIYIMLAQRSFTLVLMMINSCSYSY